MYESTFTFKTRRKHLLLVTCLVVIIQQVASMALPIQCPEPCECYLNNNGIQSARCTELYQNQTAFENIHVLVLRADEYEDECEIPKNIAGILPQLNYLYMVNCSLTSIPSGVFEDLHLLEEVDLSNNYIKKLDPSVFINNGKLLYANLQNNPFHVVDKPFLISKSLEELELQNCGIHEIPRNMFKNLTRLKYLTLSDNKLRTINENTLPNNLKSINLARNRIKNVPTAELYRLKRVREIDLSENPINCTCELMGFQNWMSGKAVRFANHVTCAHPSQYAGKRLSELPQYELCDARVAAETELCGDDQICSNQILPEEGTTKKNDVKEYFERDEVLPVYKKIVDDDAALMQSDSASGDEGSGDDIDEAGTDTPEIAPKKPENPVTEAQPNVPAEGAEVTKTSEGASDVAKETTSEASQDILKSNTNETNAPPSEGITEKDNSVTSYHNEIVTSPNTTEKSVDQANKEEPTSIHVLVTEEPLKVDEESSGEPDLDVPESPKISENPENKATEESVTVPATIPSEPSKVNESFPQPPSGKLIPDTPPTENTPDKPTPSTTIVLETETLKPTSENKTNSIVTVDHLHSSNESSSINYGYIIPCLAILVVVIICLGVYLGQRSSHKKKWENKDANGNGGTEMQDVSLLPDKSKTPIVKHNKYPSEMDPEQTERLMSDVEPSTQKSAWSPTEEPLENGNANRDKLPNGQSNDKNEPIECAIAKVTTLPDSIPRTPVIRSAT